jgi:small conductance mechanosensitive channel
MIAEDQFGVGDVVDLGQISGAVEAVGLRVTRLRDTDGTVWYLRNGEVLRVGNRSQGWARAVLDIGIAYVQVVSHARDVLFVVAQGLQNDPAFEGVVLEDPEVWGGVGHRRGVVCGWWSRPSRCSSGRGHEP